MELQDLFDIITRIAPYLFGAGGLLAYFQERKKRKVELSHQEAGALQSMQLAYDTFVNNSMDIIKRLEKEVDTLNTKIEEQKKAFEDYKNQCTVKH